METDSDTITIPVPKTLQRKRIEIIMLPLDDAPIVADKESLSQNDFIQKYAGSLPDFPDIDSEGYYEAREPVA